MTEDELNSIRQRLDRGTINSDDVDRLIRGAEQLRHFIYELANDLELEINDRYEREEYANTPLGRRRKERNLERDLDLVRRARTLINSGEVLN